MGVLPVDLMRIIGVFAPLFSERAWRHVPVLLGGAILAPGQRTVTAVLRVMGFGHERCFHKYHRVLSHARWSVLAAGRLLLGELLAVLAPTGPVVMGLDDTIERRWGERIAARGIYRDPVRSSRGHFVKTSGLRWLSLMLLAPVPWAQRVWALPFLTVLFHFHINHKIITTPQAKEVWRWDDERAVVSFWSRPRRAWRRHGRLRN